MGLINLDIISTVVQRSVTGRPVPTGNTIIMQGGADIDNIIDKISADLRDKYLSKTTDDEALGMINFKPGLKIGGIELKYDEENNAVFIERSDGNPVNFYATGGLSMYGLGNTKVTSIMDAIEANIDPNTLGIVNGKLTVIGGGGSGGEGGITAVTKQMVIEALGFTPYSAENPNGYITAASIPSALKNPYALTFGSKTYDGSAAKSITASDLGAALSSDLSKYLPLTGGTVNGIINLNYNLGASSYIRLTNNRTKESSGWAVSMYDFRNHENVSMAGLGAFGSANTLSYLHLGHYGYDGNNLRVYSNKVTFGSNTIWHAGNFNPANYLPLSGGTISGKLTITHSDFDDLLTIRRITADGNVVIKYANSSEALGHIGMSGPAGLYPYEPYFRDKNGKGHKIWHSGNGGSGSGLDADLLDGKHLADILASNVASATKLSDNTSYTAWGQTFFTNGKPQSVSGDLSSVGNVISSGAFIGRNSSKANESYFGNASSGVNGDGALMYAYGVRNLYFYTNGVERIRVDSSGNVGIGTTSPSVKLHVSGDVACNAILTSLLSSNFNDVWSDGTNSHVWYGYDHRHSNTGVYSTTLSDYFGLTLKTAKGNISVKESGEVGIGTTNPSAKLHVVGNILATGGVTMQSQRSLKNVVDERGLSLAELSNIKPTRYTWKDKRDDRIHFGGIADDIEKVLPEVIYKTAEGTLTMDYGNAGFAIASSLIKPVIDHETEIRKLKIRVKELEEELKRYSA